MIHQLYWIIVHEFTRSYFKFLFNGRIRIRIRIRGQRRSRQGRYMRQRRSLRSRRMRQHDRRSRRMRQQLLHSQHRSLRSQHRSRRSRICTESGSGADHKTKERSEASPVAVASVWCEGETAKIQDQLQPAGEWDGRECLRHVEEVG